MSPYPPFYLPSTPMEDRPLLRAHHLPLSLSFFTFTCRCYLSRLANFALDSIDLSLSLRFNQGKHSTHTYDCASNITAFESSILSRDHETWNGLRMMICLGGRVIRASDSLKLLFISAGHREIIVDRNIRKFNLGFSNWTRSIKRYVSKWK